MIVSPKTVLDLQVIRHEVGHTVSAYFVLGPDVVKSVTWKPNGKYLGCSSFTIPAELEYTKHPALLAADCAVVLMAPIFLQGAAVGFDPDLRQAEACAAVAYKYAPGKVEDVDAWRDAWDAQIVRRIVELLGSKMYWGAVNALELALDSRLTLSGAEVRHILDEATATL